MLRYDFYFKEEKPKIALLARLLLDAIWDQGIFCPFQRVTCRLYSLEIATTKTKKPVKFIGSALPDSPGFLQYRYYLNGLKTQMATDREGVMKKEMFDPKFWRNSTGGDSKYVRQDFVIEVIERHIEKQKIDIIAPIIVSVVNGVGRAETSNCFNTAKYWERMGASRAAVMQLCRTERQSDKPDTVRPNLYCLW
jgi:electron transfer flavoprotein alpha subunit